MRAYIPFEITDEKIVSSSIAEPANNEPIWSSTTTYAEFAQVSVISTNSHLVYESLEDGNVGNNPVTTNTDVLKTGAKWILKGKTNRFRMFDYNQGNPSVTSSPLTVVLRPGRRIDALTLELKAAELDITIRNGIDGPTVFTMDGYLLERNVSSFYEYFYSPFVYRKLVTTFAIPPVPDPVIYLTLSDPSGIVEVSRFAVGLSVFLGTSMNTSPVADSDNYSEVTWDDFGRATLKPVPSIPKVDVQLFAPAIKTELIRQFKSQSEAKAVVWSGLDDLEDPYTQSLVLFGVHRSFPLDLSDPEMVVINLSLKGI